MCRTLKLLKTKFSIGVGSSLVGSVRSLSLVYWSCKFARYCACSHSVKCLPILHLLKALLHVLLNARSSSQLAASACI